MSVNLEIDVPCYEVPDLALPERIVKPLEVMTIKEYAAYLEYMPDEQLPELSTISDVIVEKLSKAEYSKVMFGGRYAIMQESIDFEAPEFHKPSELKTFHIDLKVPYINQENRRKNKGVFAIFEESSKAPKFSSVIFNPSYVGDYGETKNLFRGFPLVHDTYVPIDIDPCFTEASYVISHVKEHYPNASRVIEHIFNNIADGNLDLALQIIAFIADILQKPEKSPMLALILRSPEKGTGKSIFASIIQELVGQRLSLKVKDLQHIIGKHNPHLVDKLVVIGEELSFGGSHDTNDKIKDLITSSHQTIEPKFKDVIQVRKYFRLVLCTNKDWAVNASGDERRYIIADVAPHQAQNDEYFAPMLDGDSINKLMIKDLFDFLMSVDYGEIDLSKGVETEGMKNQKMESMTPLEQWWDSCLEDERIGDGYELIPGDNDLDNGLISKKNIYASYITWLDIAKPNDKTRISNRNVFGQKFLALARFKDKTLINSDKKNSQGDRCYQFGSIEELKKVFRSKF